MTKKTDLNAPEPPPRRNATPAIWALVIEDMLKRDQEGERKYGTRLQAFNGRDALVDAYQEALDLVVYLRQAIEERRVNPPITKEEKKQGATALETMEDLLDLTPCDLDHNGACQAHNWFGEADHG